MLYINATIVTMNGRREILTEGALLVKDTRIADIGKTKALRAAHPEEPTYDLENKLVIPGLIDTHVHLAQAMLRGSGDDCELIEWLCEKIWVLQGQMTAEEARGSARLCIAEMLKSGTTCFVEAVSFYFSTVTLRTSFASFISILTLGINFRCALIGMVLMVSPKPSKNPVSVAV